MGYGARAGREQAKTLMSRQPWEYTITPQFLNLIDHGIELLSQWMPETIRAPGDAQPALNAAAKDSLHRGKTIEHERRREARVGRVLRAHFDWGWSTAEIARYESLTKRRVQQLLVEYGQVVATGPAA